jgi:hypothetical protein
MTDWFRRKSWSRNDEEEFFKKLYRARKVGRAQYVVDNVGQIIHGSTLPGSQVKQELQIPEIIPKATPRYITWQFKYIIGLWKCF